MVYYQYAIAVAPEWRDILLAYLSETEFDSFEETEKGLHAFLPASADQPAVEEALSSLQQNYPFHYVVKRLPQRNWNAVWEANFKPIRVGDFCGVRADFHPPVRGVKYELIINPQMAFGTGHHETTFMMIQLMQQMECREARVLDYGSGTGILAILAAKMGARRVEAIDIETAAFENTIENAELNGVASQVKAVHGNLENSASKRYDIILANINRNVILASLPALYEKLSVTGKLLISGILKTDEALVAAEARSLGFHLQERTYKGEWCSFRFSGGRE